MTAYYVTLFVLALVSTWWIFKKVLKIAVDKNIVDNPDARKLQKTPVPVLGGVAVFFGMVVAMTVSGMMFDCHALLPVIGLMTIMLYVGTMDDILSISPYTRLLIEIAVVLVLIFSNGTSLNSFHGLFGIWELPNWFAVPLTVFACVGIINAINFIDGVNGLSSGYCISACVVFAIAFIWAGDQFGAALSLLSIGALVPFFCHNVFGRKSKMFIGDGGTMLMGTVMSAFVIEALNGNSVLASKVDSDFGLIPFALAVLAIPVFDTLRVVAMRIIRRTSPFNPDKTHLHHLLLDMGFSHVGTTAVEILTNLMVIGAWFISYKAGVSLNMQLSVVILLGVGVTFGFYKFCRIHQRKNTKFYQWMQHIGKLTHVGHKHWFESFRNVLDRGWSDDI